MAEAIANILGALRNEKGMSKSALADFADVERCYVRDIEKGNRKPTVNMMFCICEAPQIDPADLFVAVAKEVERLKKADT